MIRRPSGPTSIANWRIAPVATQRISVSRVSIAGVLLLTWIAIANAQPANAKPKPNGSISGRVTIDGKAAAGVPVAAVLGESVNRRDAAGRAVSDVQGYYLISGLTRLPKARPAFVGASRSPKVRLCRRE
jgi:hypothetical protein